jgi:transcriptional regulator of met regulon
MKKREEPVRRVCVDIPVSLFKILDKAVTEVTKKRYGGQREALIEAIKLWLKKKGYKTR